jgi:hypothetical protein
LTELTFSASAYLRGRRKPSKAKSNSNRIDTVISQERILLDEMPPNTSWSHWHMDAEHVDSFAAIDEPLPILGTSLPDV